MSPTIRIALRAAIARLDAAGVDAPASTARQLLSVATSRPREWLLAHDDETLPEAQARALETLLARVAAREPLAYVLGERGFHGLTLKIDPRALIPRPETEMLVDLALAAVRALPAGAAVIDVGTGSGAAAIAIALGAPTARVIACDVSADALSLARENAERLGARVSFVESDLLSNVPDPAPIVVANLPYVTREEIDMLPPEIQAHEPRVALDGGTDGLDLVRRLLAQLSAEPARRAALRHVWLEVGASQGPAALALARAAFPDARTRILQDLARLDRVIAIEFEA
ncbi:MAG: peptide chain release factor N(5)-glutamine methyltransferase [Thermoflexales bacterium]|nr:peptide chain release factor N(5)-glutamine methyltransferase [Thermoflexales bacterium]